MKQILVGLMSLVLLFAFVGCKEKESEEHLNSQDYFNGTITEINENSFLVEPVEGEDILKSSDLISISKSIVLSDGLPYIKVGDEVRIEYDGTIAESYPAQLMNVYAVYLVDGGLDDQDKNSDEIDKSEIPIGEVQYIRTNGYNEWMEYPYLITVNSFQELNEYYSSFNGLFDLGQKSEIYADTAIGWLDSVKGYDEQWFSEHTLLMVILEEGSGSVGHQVKGIHVNNDTRFVIIERTEPEMGTTDMAEWHILIELGETVEMDGVQIDDSINLKDKTVYTVEEMSKLLTDFIINAANNQLSDEEKDTIINNEEPMVERLSYGSMKDQSLHYFYENYDPGYDEAPIWMVTFNTTLDGLLGPITYYVDSSGHVIAANWRL